MTEKSKGYEANAQFAKVQRAQDAKKATSEYESMAAALRAKTEKLKALRLARDAAAPPQPAAAKRKAKRKGHVRQPVGLAGRTSQGWPQRLSGRQAARAAVAFARSGRTLEERMTGHPVSLQSLKGRVPCQTNATSTAGTTSGS